MNNEQGLIKEAIYGFRWKRVGNAVKDFDSAYGRYEQLLMSGKLKESPDALKSILDQMAGAQERVAPLRNKNKKARAAHDEFTSIIDNLRSTHKQSLGDIAVEDRFAKWRKPLLIGGGVAAGGAGLLYMTSKSQPTQEEQIAALQEGQV